MTPTNIGKEKPGPLIALYMCIVFLTRIPAPPWPKASSYKISECSWGFPIAGVLVALIGGIAFSFCSWLNLPSLVSGLVAIVTMTIATGGLHEDGLADFVDGIFGGETPKKRMEIMSDSRIGVFGTIAIIFSFICRASLITAIEKPLLVLGALTAAAAISRAMLPIIMSFSQPAKTTGIAFEFGKPSLIDWCGGIALAVFIVILSAPAAWLMCLITAVLGAVIIAWISEKKIQGYTGDSLGASQQISELFALAIITSFILPTG